MNDISEHIKKLHLQIWLSKTPGERLRQFLVNNEQKYAFWKSAKEQMEKQYPGQHTTHLKLPHRKLFVNYRLILWLPRIIDVLSRLTLKA